MKTESPLLSRDDGYLKLIQQFPLRALWNDREHAQAAERLVRLAGRDEQLEEGERAYLDALTILVRDYERKHHRIERSKSTPLERLKFLMDESGMNVSDLGRIIGSQSSASMILSGKRSLSKVHILKLAERFKVEPGLFMR